MFVLHETYKVVTNSNDPKIALLLGMGLVVILVFTIWMVWKG